MELVAGSRFDRAWLEARLEPEDYFARLLRSGVARRHAWLRELIENRRKVVRGAWRDGDELWYWRFRVGGGISGADGLAILRGGDVTQVWCYGTIL